MKNFFIPQLTLLLLTFNGNIVGMHRATMSPILTKFFVHKNQPRLYSVDYRVAVYDMTWLDDSQEMINNKDNRNKQEGSYIIRSRYIDYNENKMAFYKKCQRPNASTE